MNKAEMNIIMTERIEKFNAFVMSKDIDQLPIGLFNGKMGICIYFYYQSRLTKNKSYGKFAKKLLDSIYNQINTKTLIDLEDGLIGICLGVYYLIKNNFLKGNVNYVLAELDDRIFNSLCFSQQNSNNFDNYNFKTILEATFYFQERLKDRSLDKQQRFIYENLVIKLINKVEDSFIPSEVFSEPPLFSINDYLITNYLFVLSQVYNQNFYNYKVTKIYDELSDRLLSTYPLAQSNRLLLIGGMKNVVKSHSLPKWEEHIILLESRISSQKIFQEEFRDNSILIANGISGLYLIINKLFKCDNINHEDINNKIVSSEIWDLYFNKDDERISLPIGLATGFCGIILIYEDTLKSDL